MGKKRRGWWIVGALVVAVLAVPFLQGASASVAVADPEPVVIQQQNSRQSRWNQIAEIRGTDGIALTHVSNLLSLHGIGAAIFGSMIYFVIVEEADADRAMSLLIADATKNPYWLRVDDKTFESAAKSITVQINQKADEHGRIKANPRNPYVERAVRKAYLWQKRNAKEQNFAEPKWDFVKHIEMAKRRYLNRKGHWAVGYDFTVEFGSTESTRANMKYYGCVWDEGKRCQVSGYSGSFGQEPTPRDGP